MASPLLDNFMEPNSMPFETEGIVFRFVKRTIELALITLLPVSHRISLSSNPKRLPFHSESVKRTLVLAGISTKAMIEKESLLFVESDIKAISPFFNVVLLLFNSIKTRMDVNNTKTEINLTSFTTQRILLKNTSGL